MNPNDETERRTPFPGPNAPRRPQAYKFTHEELRVLKECNNESFYQRCIPFGTILGGAAYYAVKIGRLRPSPSWGAAPKVTAAVLVGYFLGKMSYQNKCAEKLMALPDSKVGQMLRAKRAGTNQESLDSGFGPSLSLSPFSGMTDSYSDIGPPGDYDYDNRPQAEGLDDSFRPSVDNPIIIYEEEMPPEQKSSTTYDELRKKNREEYEQRRLSSFREPPRLSQSIPSDAPSPTSRISEFDEFLRDKKPPPSNNKNKYGDVWG